MLQNTTEKIEITAAVCTLMFSLESIASSYIKMVNCRVHHVIKRWNARCTIAEEKPLRSTNETYDASFIYNDDGVFCAQNVENFCASKHVFGRMQCCFSFSSGEIR